MSHTPSGHTPSYVFVCELSFDPAFSELGISHVNTIVLAFPSQPSSELTLDHMTPIWKEAETFFHQGVAKEVGVADLDKDQLEELYNWATLKPMVDQVNVAHCCTIPEVSLRGKIMKRLGME